MMYVINVEYSNFSVPEEVAEVLKCGCYPCGEDMRAARQSTELIEWVKAHKGETDLAVVEIPAEATDWEVIEYDGYEHIIAVVDGKICHLYGEE